MFSLEGQWIIIQAYKHNEELHRQWSHTYVIEDNDEYFVTVSNRASVVECDGRKWHTKEPALFILSKKKWFNVIAMFKESGGITYYTNIASPTIYDKGFLKYIDYDLDVKLFEDGGTRLLDVAEYNKHAIEQHYSNDIKEVLEKTVNEVYELIKKREFPFVDETARSLYQKFLDKVNQ